MGGNGMRKLWPGVLLVLVAAAFGGVMWHHLPLRVASHWNASGQVNGWTSRTALVILLPAVALVMAVVLRYVPQIDPKRRNFPLHAPAYWLVVNVLLGFLAVLHVAIIGYNLGWSLSINTVVGVAVGVLFVVTGNVLTRVRPNWIFGVRTPWTLSSDLSWRETHRLAGYLFVVAGLGVAVCGLVRPEALFAAIMVGIIGAALVSVIYSYFAWKRDPNAQGREA
jgi:immunity protein, SdpI family